MKILLIVDDYLPGSVKIAAKMMHELAVELQHQEHEVTVLTPTSFSRAREGPYLVETIRVLPFYAGKIKNTSMLKRAVNETLLSFRAWKSLKREFIENRHQRIVYYSPSIFWSGIVKKLKRLWSCDSYLILRDIFPQWALDAGLLQKNSIAFRYFKFFERRCYAAANCIGVQSPANLTVIQSANSPKEVLYNWTKGQTRDAGELGYRKSLGLENKVVFFYGGNIGHAQDMSNIIRLADNMQSNDRAHFLLVGRGDEFELVERQMASRRLENMTLLPAVAQETYYSMLKEFDVGLLSLHSSHKAHNFPGKLLGYMEASKPILASINPKNDLAEVLEASNAGFSSINGADDQLFENAQRLVSSSALRAEMGQRSNELLKQRFSVRAAALQVAREIL